MEGLLQNPRPVRRSTIHHGASVKIMLWMEHIKSGLIQAYGQLRGKG